VFRTLEFEQMEIEFFVEPGTDEDWFEQWVDAREQWYLDLGVDPDNLRRYEHPKEKLSHYSKRTVDLEYRYPFGEGWGELEGIANRTDFDLGQHEKFSGERLRWYDDQKKEHVLPYVVEPAAGLTRAALVFMIDAYEEEVVNPEKGDVRTVLKLHPALAPYKIAIMPLSKKPELLEISQALYGELRKRWMVVHDTASGIGKAYRRQDEIGTPYCVTVDFDTLEDEAVTVRDRDTMQQERVDVADLEDWFARRLRF
jgi:glycyl-tRNA synthetase